VLANAVNAALAYWFIFVLRMGVAGAGWATVIAHAVEAGFQSLIQQARGWHVRATRARHLRELWRIGLPTGLQFALGVGAFALLGGLIAHLSEVEMSAHQIALQVIHFSFLPAFSVAEAASVLVGQAVGAGRDEWVIRMSRLALWTVSIYTGLCT